MESKITRTTISIEKQTTSSSMANLPPTLDFAKAEEEICAKWAAEDTFKNQDALSLARGDEVSEK